MSEERKLLHSDGRVYAAGDKVRSTPNSLYLAPVNVWSFSIELCEIPPLQSPSRGPRSHQTVILTAFWNRMHSGPLITRSEYNDRFERRQHAAYTVRDDRCVIRWKWFFCSLSFDAAWSASQWTQLVCTKTSGSETYKKKLWTFAPRSPISCY